METDDYDYGGWLVRVRGRDPTMFYAATFDTPEEAVEAVSQSRGDRGESYEAVGRFLSGLETVRGLPRGVAVIL